MAETLPISLTRRQFEGLRTRLGISGLLLFGRRSRTATGIRDSAR